MARGGIGGWRVPLAGYKYSSSLVAVLFIHNYSYVLQLGTNMCANRSRLMIWGKRIPLVRYCSKTQGGARTKQHTGPTHRTQTSTAPHTAQHDREPRPTTIVVCNVVSDSTWYATLVYEALGESIHCIRYSYVRTTDPLYGAVLYQ